jgi:hypothetical protein
MNNVRVAAGDATGLDGGIFGNSAIKGFAKTKDAQPSTATDPHSQGNVIGLVLIASGFTLTGLTFIDPFFGYPPP